MWKHYHIIETTEELTELLAKQSGLTKIISGGTDLMVEINSDKWPELDTVWTFRELSHWIKFGRIKTICSTSARL